MKHLIFVGMVAVFAHGNLFAQAQPTTLGSVRLTHGVKANGSPLAAGTYQVRIVDGELQPAAGQSPSHERWVEFVKGGKVVGREVATVIPSEEIGQIVKGPMPKANGSRVDTLKGGDFIRLWINRGGTNYLINLPPT